MDEVSDSRSRPARRTLAAITKGHELGGHHLSAEDADRARRVIIGELSPADARNEMNAALQELVDRENNS